MPMFAAITLASPLMMLGMGLLTLPIAAHLLHRRAKRRLVFPSISLLSESSASQSQLFKLRRWVLLLLRCLAVAALVLGFAGPVWHEGPSAASTGDEGVAVVLLADISASSSQQVDGVSAVATLRAAGARTIDDLLLGADVGAVVRATARPTAVPPVLTSNLPMVQNEINLLKPTAGRADLSAAMALAGKLLAQRQGPHHQLLLAALRNLPRRPNAAD